jgi:gliding motility-associated-like protein
LKKPFYIFLFIILFCCEAKTQINLVTNGSFEDTLVCPFNQGQVSFANNWNEYASADYFNNCSSSPMFSTPFNFGGYQMPKDGNAYVGLNTFADYLVDGREYIYSKLKNPLIIGEKYYVSFYICCSKANFISASKYSNNIGCRFTTFYPNVSQVVNYSHINTANLQSDTVNWTKVDGVFIADSVYEYLSLGNFYNDINTQVGSFFSNTQNIAYYYIDDVFVGLEKISPLNNDIVIPNIFTPNNDNTNDNWEFKLNDNLSCIVYNRWGLKIFETTKSIIKWDGRTTSGEQCVDGNYFYTIETKEKKIRGFIQLIR